MISPIQRQLYANCLSRAARECCEIVRESDDPEIKTIAYSTMQAIENLVKRLEEK